MSDGITDMMIEKEAFETFAKFYPTEAYDQNKEWFYEYFNKNMEPKWSHEAIDQFVIENRD